VFEQVNVWLLDASALIESKSLAFKTWEVMVGRGEIALPREVIREVTSITHTDVPGAWAAGVRSLVKHPLDPEWSFLATVMVNAGDVVDANKTEDDADPHVLALALQLQAGGLNRQSSDSPDDRLLSARDSVLLSPRVLHGLWGTGTTFGLKNEVPRA
jgi:hypothetical protein